MPVTGKRKNKGGGKTHQSRDVRGLPLRRGRESSEAAKAAAPRVPRAARLRPRPAAAISAVAAALLEEPPEGDMLHSSFSCVAHAHGSVDVVTNESDEGSLPFDEVTSIHIKHETLSLALADDFYSLRSLSGSLFSQVLFLVFLAVHQEPPASQQLVPSPLGEERRHVFVCVCV